MMPPAHPKSLYRTLLLISSTRDRWSVVDVVLENMGFGKKWREWIRVSLTTASMSILVNGTPTIPFKLHKGLRQGDPLSPFLFVLVGQVLNSMLRRLSEIGRIKPLEIGRDKIQISHLQFADDTILFCPCDVESMTNYKRIFQGFEIMSSLKINYDKSVVIGINCGEETIDEACGILECNKAILSIRYLGIPLGANPKRVKTWDPIIKKVKERLKGWEGKFLTKVGKLVLIKAVLNSLPMYYLSMFKISKAVAARLFLYSRDFFGLRQMVERVCRRFNKEECLSGGGGSIRRNVRFGRKVVWSCNNLDGGMSFENQNLKRTGGVWADIGNIRMSESSLVDIYQEGLQLQVGNETKTKFWHDLWVQEGRLKEVFPSLYRVTLNKECSISECDIWDGYIWRWSLQWRRALWEWEEQDLVKLLVILSKIGIRQEEVDTLKWKHHKQGSS
ncbi:uncharacterized protein [Arachis hypogaea]|uniref:uncharacterized protein n=1 Tax=Arachis hypogaea TaxID=3818 RepID=UPI003B2268E0